MHCFEDARTGQEVPAVAMCQACGAGVCAAHVAQRTVSGVRTNAVGAPSAGPDRRVLHCLACARP
ncbi:DUF2180 family protein [Cellulosimicrobium cellulans]|uniref:DUF2180 family protein n=1 Tax=Cellulosimicrobium cellulans TaxID=1710 RepID=UPI00130EA13C|nr:DUF2180 family protein [Cellulosimicrobium cellulans]